MSDTTEIYAWFSTNERGQEVLLGRKASDGQDFAAAETTQASASSYAAFAQRYADFYDRPVHLVKFTHREPVLTIQPNKDHAA